MTIEPAPSLPQDIDIWIDGRKLAPIDAKVSVLDRGFLYGDSVFETLRTYNKEPFALDAHLDRLAESARRVLIRLPIELSRLSEEVQRAVREAEYPECTLRVMVTRGLGALGLDPQAAVHPLRVLLVTPLRSPPLSDYRDGIKVVTFETSRVVDATPAAGAKVGNYLVAVLATEKASRLGAKEALIASSTGKITEGATSNLFWFEKGELWTPPLEAGILAGITRSHLLEAAAEISLSVRMRVPSREELVASDGVFISSSIRELLPVVQIDEDPICGRAIPALTRRLHAQFRKKAGVPALALEE
jgi:branched-chain amino acid aminotransferase